MTTSPPIATTLSELTTQERVQADKYLSFSLGSENYGLEILKVREIIGIIDITPLPQTPEYVKGVINLRGKIIPVISLRTKFGMPSIDYTDATCVIVVEVRFTDSTERFSIGVIVDTVNEVLDIQREQIEPPPDFGCRINTDYTLGMGKVKERVVILLQVDKVMTESEIRSIRTASTSSDADKPNGESEPTAT